MNQFLEILIVKVVDLDLLEEWHKGILEIMPWLLDIDERLADEDQLKLLDRLSGVVS